MKRVLSGVVLIVLAAAVVGWAPRWVFFVALMLLSSLALTEFFQLSEKSGIQPLRMAGYLYGFWLLGERLVFPQEFSGAAFSAFVLTVLGLSLRDPSRFSKTIASAGATVVGTLYIAGSLSLLLCWQDPGSDRAISYHSSFEHRSAIFFLLGVVWAADTGAYYTGRAFGKHKLAPRVSPGKTVEGLVGGLLASLLVAVVFQRYGMRNFALAGILSLAAALNIAGVFGDLVESAVKRGAGAKDSSALIPGHGGILDRIDSLLFAIPVMYYYPSVIAFLKSIINSGSAR